MLVCLAGLPGVGKTTIAKVLAEALPAALVRADTIEQALRDGGQQDVGPLGYFVAYRVAAENLRLGFSVVADTVNPLGITRKAWREVAEETGARLVNVEVVCSDLAIHRRRLEGRESDIPTLIEPTWQSVVAHRYETDWHDARLVVDTSGTPVSQAVATVLAHVRAGSE